MQSMLVFSVLLGVILSQSKLDKILLIANYFSIVYFLLLWFFIYYKTTGFAILTGQQIFFKVNFFSKSWKRHTKMVDTDCP